MKDYPQYALLTAFLINRMNLAIWPLLNSRGEHLAGVKIVLEEWLFVVGKVKLFH